MLVEYEGSIILQSLGTSGLLPDRSSAFSCKVQKFLSELEGNHMKKLYVGNLSFETTETELKELFNQVGLVETVRIITDRETGRSKGFAFVEMREGGDKAIAEINGKDFNGRSMSVNEARPMTSRDSEGGFKRY